MFFARAQDEIKRLQQDLTVKSRTLLNAPKWLFTPSAAPCDDCDVILTFGSTPQEVVDWFVQILSERVPQLSVTCAFQRRRQEHVLYVTASYKNLLYGAELIGLKRRLLPELGGGFREFIMDDIQLYDGVEDSKTFLCSQERQDIVKQYLNSLRAKPNDCIPLKQGLKSEGKEKNCHFLEGQRIVAQMQSRKFLKQVFPLHDLRALKDLSSSWVTAVFKHQPLDKIRDYFGVKIALYFAWLGHYTKALIFPTVFGLIAWKIAGKDLHMKDNRELYYVASALFNVGWATLYLEHWKRSSSELAYRWGTLDCTSELLEEPRPLFEGSPSICPITGHTVPHYPAWKRQVTRYLISMPIILLSLVSVFCSMLAIFRLQEIVDEMIADKVIPSFVQHSPKVLLAVVVGVMGEIYKRVAVWLNDLENYRLEETYVTNLVVKVILFQFVNNFLSLFYIAFYLRDLRLLKHQLAALLITKQLFGNLKEVFVPFLIFKIRQFRIALRYKQQKKEEGTEGSSSDESEPSMSQAEEEASMQRYDDPYEDYLEMFIQFGYVSMFACAFPLAGLFCLINNVIEIRSDAFKLVNSFQRPFGERAATIGIWQQAMEAMSGIAIVVNVALLGVSGGVQKIFTGLETWQVVLLLAGLEHAVIALKAGVAIAIPDLPAWIEEEMAKVEYRRREALKKQEQQEAKESASLVSTIDSSSSKELSTPR